MVNYCRSPVCLSGKTVIVTGANSGIGYETALDFAKRGARVILACRNQEKADAAKDKIILESDNKNIVAKLIDLESLESVREFAKDINDTEKTLDILVNNAGSVYLPEKVTEDGLQLLMEVNYFSHFLLTHLLIGLLKKSAPSRIVNVSSSGAKMVLSFDVKDLNSFPGSLKVYMKSKLCNIYFTQILAEKLEGTGVTTYSLHPGAVKTEAQNFSKILNFIARTTFLTSEQGAQTSIYVSVQKGIEQYSGRHFENAALRCNYWNANNPEKAKELWKITETLVKLKNDEII